LDGNVIVALWLQGLVSSCIYERSTSIFLIITFSANFSGSL